MHVPSHRAACRTTAAPPPSLPPFILRVQKDRFYRSDEMTRTKIDIEEQHSHTAVVVVLIFAAAMIFMFRDLVAKIMHPLILPIGRMLPFPGYGSVVTVDADITTPEANPDGSHETSQRQQDTPKGKRHTSRRSAPTKEGRSGSSRTKQKSSKGHRASTSV